MMCVRPRALAPSVFTYSRSVPEAAEPVAPEVALAELCAEGGVASLVGDRDPVPLVAEAARSAGKPFEHIDARGLTTLEFDRLVRGTLRAGTWEPGALTRSLGAGGVFLLAHGEGLLDDLRQRLCRMLLTQKVLLRGPAPEADRLVAAAPGTALILHVDDHLPVLLQVYAQLKLFPRRIRADVDGPPSPARR